MKSEAEASVAKNGSGQIKKKVLVVEDEEDLADLYAKWLSDEYDVRKAYSGDEAIEKYDEDVDVVFLDRRMPVATGDEVLEDIRELPGDCMAAMVTAVEPDYDILTMEFEDYVKKPISEDDLLEVAESLVDLSERDEDTQRSFALASKSAALNLDELAKAAGREEPDADSLVEGLVDTVSSICSPALVAVWSYDDEDPGLSLKEYSGELEDEFSDEILELAEDTVWEAYSHGPNQTEYKRSDLPDEIPESVGYCLSNRVGRHGVVLTFLSSEDEVSNSEEAALRSSTAMVGSSLDNERNRERANEHERLSDEYRERTEELEELNRMMRETSKGILEAATRTEIEQAACRNLMASRFVEFVWVGDYLESGGKVVCKHATDSEYMESMSENGEMEAARKVAEKKESQVVKDLRDNPPLETWREKALRNGFGSLVRVPILHNSSLHGVLTVYLNGENRDFDQLESTLRDVGRTVGHAINSYETKTSLVSNEVTELKVRVADPSFPPVRFASEVDGVVSLEGLSSSEEGSQKTYVTVNSDAEGVEETVEEVVRKLPTVDSCTHIASRGEEEAVHLTGNPFYLREILNQGATPVDLSATEESAELTVHIPKYASTTSFVSMLEEEYDEVELASTRRKEKSFETKTEFEEILDDELTERQTEIVRAAYHSGYFDSPRESTGQDIADQLGVTQPTVTESLKAAERKTFGLLFDGNSSDSTRSLR